MKPLILFIFGSRPELIKCVPLIKLFRQRDDLFSSCVCHSGQHPDLIRDLLKDFDIAVDIQCPPISNHQDLSSLGQQLLSEITLVLQKTTPHLLVVQGDTSTAFFSALAAFYLHIPIAHVEAGLRSYDLKSPWPEEGHRQLLSKLCTYHFAPTESAKRNLIRDGIDDTFIFVTGNTVVDAIQEAVVQIEQRPDSLKSLRMMCQPKGLRCFESDSYILITCHRREHLGLPLSNIINAVRILAQKFPSHFFIWPLHPNPAIVDPVTSVLSTVKNCILLDPLNYLPFVYLMQNASCILTDSGGIQEEAPSLNTPVYLLRKETERPECLNDGHVTIIGSNTDVIIDCVQDHLCNSKTFSSTTNPFGNGTASLSILHAISQFRDTLCKQPIK